MDNLPTSEDMTKPLLDGNGQPITPVDAVRKLAGLPDKTVDEVLSEARGRAEELASVKLAVEGCLSGNLINIDYIKGWRECREAVLNIIKERSTTGLLSSPPQ